MGAPLPKILCVDDEPQVLEGLSLSLRKRAKPLTATSGEKGLEVLDEHEDLAVVISDMRMPQMNGAVFLSRVRQRRPDVVRMLLTGQADIDSAIRAVNEGQIFRFLSKPCPRPQLLAAIGAAVRQHELVQSERVLLEQTLRGCIRALGDILSLASPEAFGRATRLRRRAEKIAEALDPSAVWQVEVAAMLSQIGCVTLEPATLRKLQSGEPLEPEERVTVEGLPKIVDGLLSGIPRMEEVRQAIRQQSLRFDGEGSPSKAPVGDAIPLTARVLRAVNDLEVLLVRGTAMREAVDTLRHREGAYDPSVLAVMSAMLEDEAGAEYCEQRIRSLRPGMEILDDVHTKAGLLLLARGQEVTVSMQQRLRNLDPRTLEETVVRVRVEA